MPHVFLCRHLQSGLQRDGGLNYLVTAVGELALLAAVYRGAGAGSLCCLSPTSHCVVGVDGISSLEWGSFSAEA